MWVSVYVDTPYEEVLKPGQNMRLMCPLRMENIFLLPCMPRRLPDGLHLNSNLGLERKLTLLGTFEVELILACVQSVQPTGAHVGMADNDVAYETAVGLRMMASEIHAARHVQEDAGDTLSEHNHTFRGHPAPHF